MQWTGLNELREKYLSFFESKGHLRLPYRTILVRYCQAFYYTWLYSIFWALRG